MVRVGNGRHTLTGFSLQVQCVCMANSAPRVWHFSVFIFNVSPTSYVKKLHCTIVCVGHMITDLAVILMLEPMCALL